MSRDIYEHRHTFEESGPFPDLKDIVYNMPSGNVFIGTTLKVDNDDFAYKALVMPPLTDEQKEKFYGKTKSFRSMEADFQFKLEEFNRRNNIKNHGKNI